MPCYRCGVRQTDPARGESPWRRGVLRDHLVLVCPLCVERADWAAALDCCGRCGGTHLMRRLDQVDCLDCGSVREAGAGEPSASEPGASEPSASEPGASEPGASEPGASEPGASEPGAGEGGVSEGGVSESGAGGAGAAWARDAKLAQEVAQALARVLPPTRTLLSRF